MIIRIGRGPKNDIVLENRTVSREHATIEISDGRIIIRDLGSKSGTYIAGRDKMYRATYHEVTEHTLVSFGSEQRRVGDLIRQVTERDRAATYRRNPVTGEIVKE